MTTKKGSTDRKKRSVVRIDAQTFLASQLGPLSLGEAIKAIRLADEISQTEFAAMLGVSRQYLCDLENNRKPVSVAKAAKFAKKLQQPPEVFITLAIQDELTRYKLPFIVNLAEKKRQSA